jgi:hypothetical protein
VPVVHDASLHPKTAGRGVTEFHLSDRTPRDHTTDMTVQATQTQRTSSTHAFLLPVVRELPSLPTPALTTQW